MTTYAQTTMDDNLNFLRRLGIPGSAVFVLSQLSLGDEKTTAEISKVSGMSKSSVLNGIHFWQKCGVARRSSTNKWQINSSQYVDDEASILKVLAVALGVAPSSVGDALDVARGIDPSPIQNPEQYEGHQVGDATTYQSALVAALDDEVISEDEWAMLENLRTLLGIQPDQHALIEEAIRSMSESDENGVRRLERLQRFNTVCPYA